ncbi:MAG: LysR family transcriptional regulator [Gammaproteobacteria bacterium]|nr:LysR family transcriptional regulator [Gammaproteobacteria bacterium]
MQTPIAKTPMNIAWDDLRLILALIRGQTLAGAAEQLHVDTSTVFRGVRAIEQRLQNPLFERSRKGYTPTALGERLAQTAERIEREMLELETQLSGCAAAPTGNLRVSTTDTVLYYHLLPALPQFTARYPQIHLELVASNQLVNLSRREVDMVIRATTTPPQHWIGRCLGKLPYAIHAAPDYWKHHQHLPLDEHLWLAPDDSFGEHPTIRWRRQHYPKVVPRYRFNSICGS